MKIDVIKKVEEKPNKCLLIIGGVNCGACKQVVSALKKEDADFPAVYVDVTDAIDFANKTQMRSLPSVFLLDGDKIKARWVGNIDVGSITKEIKK